MDGWRKFDAQNLSKLLQREVTADDVEIGTWLMAQVGAKTSGLDVLQAQADMGSMRRATLEWWEKWLGPPTDSYYSCSSSSSW